MDILNQVIAPADYQQAVLNCSLLLGNKQIINPALNQVSLLKVGDVLYFGARGGDYTNAKTSVTKIGTLPTTEADTENWEYFLNYQALLKTLKGMGDELALVIKADATQLTLTTKDSKTAVTVAFNLRFEAPTTALSASMLNLFPDVVARPEANQLSTGKASQLTAQMATLNQLLADPASSGDAYPKDVLIYPTYVGGVSANYFFSLNSTLFKLDTTISMSQRELRMFQQFIRNSGDAEVTYNLQADTFTMYSQRGMLSVYSKQFRQLTNQEHMTELTPDTASTTLIAELTVKTAVLRANLGLIDGYISDKYAPVVLKLSEPTATATAEPTETAKPVLQLELADTASSLTPGADDHDGLVIKVPVLISSYTAAALPMVYVIQYSLLAKMVNASPYDLLKLTVTNDSSEGSRLYLNNYTEKDPATSYNALTMLDEY